MFRSDVKKVPERPLVVKCDFAIYMSMRIMVDTQNVDM